MNERNYKIQKIDDYRWRILREGKMHVDGIVYADESMMKEIQKDESLQQVINVACLPGIVGHSLGMPDIHWGYGFPIGGVAAFDMEDGVVSPGGVGYDINCGVRLLKTGLCRVEISGKLESIVDSLFVNIPSGVGSHRKDLKLSQHEVKNVLKNGAQWAVSHGYGSKEDLEHIEEKGCIFGADPELVSTRAIERGLAQLGTLGSGNHFVEVGYVSEIFDEKIARTLGLEKDGITIMIHTGSRGLGYQVCDDYLKILLNASGKYGFKLPDRQLACAPIQSQEGQDYFAAMQAAANFAWSNRQVIMNLAKEVLKETFSISESELGFKLLYDVCHNIAKIEKHTVGNEIKEVCVHRKGATRAFPPGSKLIPEKYKNVGQPVLIPGDMGRYSYILVGTENAMEETFGSSCHGAGRNLSRTKALKSAKGRDLVAELNKKGISIQAKGYKTIAEEMSDAYKDVSDVVDVMHKEGITRKVAKIKPVGVIKG